MSERRTAAEFRRYIGSQMYAENAVSIVMELLEALEATEKERDSYDIALQSLTPGGSEFVHDPERCVDFVEQARHGDFEALKKSKAEFAALRLRLMALENQVRGMGESAKIFQPWLLTKLADLHPEGAEGGENV